MTKLSLIKKTSSILKKINMWGTLSNSTSPKIQYNTLVPFCKIREHRSIEQGLKDNLLSYKILSKYKKAILMTSETKLTVDLSGFVDRDLSKRVFITPENFFTGMLTNDKIHIMTLANKESIRWLLTLYGFSSFILLEDPFENGYINFENTSSCLAHILSRNTQGLLAALPQQRNVSLECNISKTREALLQANSILEKTRLIDNLKTFMKENAKFQRVVQDSNPFSSVVAAMQHNFNVIVGNQRFDYTILKYYGDLHGISTSEFEGTPVSMQNFVELSVLILIAPLCKSRGVSIHLRNPDISNEFKLQAYADTGQRNPDAMLILDFVRRIVFYDIKSYTGNRIGTQTVSAFQPSEENFNKEINNMINSLNQLILDKEKRYEIEGLENIIHLKNTLIEVQKAKGKIENKYDEILNELFNAIFDSSAKFKELKIGFTIPLKEHPRFQAYYDKFLKYNIEKAAESPLVLEALKNLYPKNFQITKNVHKTANIEILKNLYPEHGEEIIVRFLKLIEYF